MSRKSPAQPAAEINSTGLPGLNYWTGRRLVFFLAAAPAVLFLLLQTWPLGHAVRTALTDADGHWSTAHIQRVYGDRLFLRSLGYSLLVPVVSVALEALIGLGLALWFYELRRGRVLWRTVALVPFAVPEIVYLLTMKLLFRQNGYLNSALWHLGDEAWTVGWLEPGRPLMVLVIILVDAWRVTPTFFLIVLTALEQLPTSYVEAARIDGAGRWQINVQILIPLAVPALLVALALRMVDAFRIFATPLVLVGVDALPVLTSVAYHYKEQANDAAAANVAALTLALTLLLLTLATIWIRLGRKREA